MSSLNENFKIKNGLTVNTTISAGSCIEGDAFKKHGGTSSQFLKADGSVDSATYTTCTGTVVAGDIVNHDQSACAGLNCVGDITAVTTGPYLTGGATSGSAEVGIDSACAAKWDTAATGGVQSLSAGDGLLDNGTATDPNIAVDSTVVRTSGAQSIAGDKCFTDNITVGSNIYHHSDTNTRIGFATDSMFFNAGGSTFICIDENGQDHVVINPAANDIDLRVKGTNGDNTLFVSATAENVGIGTDTPGEKLDVIGNVQVTDGEFIGDLRGAVHFKAQAGEDISEGEAVYISGISGNTTVVSLADADDASKMPAFGIATETATSGNPITVGNFGALDNLNTTQWGAEGTELFVGTTAGQLVSAAPTGESAALQKIAKITRAHASTGSITIMGAGRSNAVPNLDNGDIFIGNGSNQAVTASLQTCTEAIGDAKYTQGVTTTGEYLTGGGTTGCFNIGIDSACGAKWDTAAAGDISAVTTSSLLSGGGTSGSVEVGIDSGALDYLNQSACAGIDCTGTMTSVGVSDGLESTGGNSPTLGIATACNTKWDQSGCAGLNCVGTVVASDISSFTSCLGDITGVTAGLLLSGGGTSGSVTLGLDSGALTGLDQSACAGIDCTGTVTSIGVSDGLESTGGNSPTLGIATACNTKWDQSGCAGLNCVGTVVAGDISGFTDCLGDITAVCAGTLLSGGAVSGDATIGINSGALDYLNQSACPGIDCVGTVVAGDIAGFTDCTGTVTSVGVSDGLESTGGNSPTLGIATACNTKWDQSGCTGLNCVGDITAVTTGPYLTGGATSGSAEVGIDSACAAKWDSASAGGITGVTAGLLLSGGGTSGSVTLGLDSGALTGLDQSACAGIDCTGTMTSVGVSDGLETTGGNSPTLGIATACNTKWDQSGCAGLTCTGTVVAGDISSFTSCTGTTTPSNTQTFTNKSGNISQWTNDSGYTTCTGTVVAGDLTGLDQSACAGLDCVGDITGVTAGLLLSGGGATGSVTLGLDSGALAGLDQSSCAGILCTGTTTASNSQTFTNKAGNISQWTNDSGYTTCTGTVVAGDISSFTSCQGTTTPSNTQTFTNKSGNISQWTNDSGYTTCTGTVVAGDIAGFTSCLGDITGVTAGLLLSGGGASGSVTLGLDSGALAGLDQSSCAGILCTGTMTSVGVSDGLETTGGNSPTLGIATTCNTKWDQSGCAGINCVGTVVAGDISSFTSCLGDITAVTTSTDYMTGGGTSGDVQVGIDSACTAKWDAGGGISSGTACKLTKYNAAGTDIENSIVTEGSSLITIAGALDVDNICSNDASNNICYGLNVGGGGIANTSIGCCAANAMSTGFNNVAIGPAAMKIANGVCCNVALGVNAAEDLTVGGDDNVAIGTFAMTNGTTTTDSIAIGKCAMGVGVTTGACNVAIGFETMKNTTSGCNNTAVGSFSMAANATGEFNTSLGFKSLCSIVGGDRNVAIGNTAGKSITSGCDNVAIGHNALCSSLNGCFNVAIGRRAMIAVTTGNDNVAIGQDALSDTTSGCCNVALGLQSMDGNTTGSYNVSIGQQAMFYALSGDHNLAMGQYALYDNWGGDYNTAVGTAAMQCNTTGSNNAALGYRAMMNNTTGNDNFAVGECALQSNVNGIGNTALGHNAFGSSVTGNYSVAIGDNAGTYFANGCTTLSAASDSIYIGRNTRGKDNNDSNSIVIGYNACSCGANTIKLGSNSITAACIQVAWTAVSDERDKTDITDLNHGLEFIGDLKPKAFKYRKTRTSSANDGVCRYGFLAQDIQETEDGDKVIVSESNPEQLGLNSDYLVPILVKAVQELEARVKELEG